MSGEAASRESNVSCEERRVLLSATLCATWRLGITSREGGMRSRGRTELSIVPTSITWPGSQPAVDTCRYLALLISIGEVSTDIYPSLASLAPAAWLGLTAA